MLVPWVDERRHDLAVCAALLSRPPLALVGLLGKEGCEGDRTLLNELARAYMELAWLESGGKAEEATDEAALPPREWSSTEGVPTRVWVEARLLIRQRRAALTAWLDPSKVQADTKQKGEAPTGVIVHGNLD